MSGRKLRAIVVVGARPNFMKAAPVLEALRRSDRFEALLVHTGQHYDERMSDLFFRDLGMPRPDVNLDARSGTHAVQTAEVMMRFERYLAELKPQADLVLVFGDINSTVACSLVAAKAGIRLAHVEAGLRSFDRGMPEELNRICTDQLADLCYVTERAGVENLAREGKPADATVLVGNTMIDTLLRHRERARDSGARRMRELGLEARGFAVVTLHRPSNVDEAAPLARILDALKRIAAKLPILWPAHPRMLARAQQFGLSDRLLTDPRIRVVEPQGYLDFLGLVDAARVVLTDSGGIQEEAAVLQVPCVTLRENTERPSTLETGGNLLAGSDPDRIVQCCERMLALDRASIAAPPLWDGQAAGRIVAHLEAGAGSIAARRME